MESIKYKLWCENNAIKNNSLFFGPIGVFYVTLFVIEEAIWSNQDRTDSMETDECCPIWIIDVSLLKKKKMKNHGQAMLR